MTQLWISTESGEHAVFALERAEQEIPASLWPGCAGAPPVATLVRVDERETWALLATDERVRVNGIALVTGLAMVTHRDEILCPGAPPLWLSTERIARIEPTPRDGRPLICPRCLLPIEPASQAVACPGCGVWHHQTDEFPCFTYQGAGCASCSAHFELDGGFLWTPDEL